MEKLSCVVLNYNDYPTTERMIKNIEEYDILDHIIVVDNMSTDDSLKFLKKEFKDHLKVSVISSQRNGGYGYGNNFGVKFAKKTFNSQYVIISNPDVDFSEDTAKELLNLIQEKNAALVSATQLVSGIPEKNCAWKIPSAMEWCLIETRFFHNFAAKKYYYPATYTKKIYSKVDCVRGAMFLIDTKKFLEVGGYDERMFLFGEETLIGYKLKQKQYPTYILNNVFYDHKHSTTINKSIPSTIEQDIITHHSKLIFMRDYLHINFVEELIIKFIFKFEILKKGLKL